MTGADRTALVVGIGNPDRGDDGVGAAVATAVASHRLAGVSVKHLREPVALLDEEPDYDLVIVVDAVLSRAEPGSVSVREVDEHPLPDWAGTGGTHTVGLPAVVELARALGRLPRPLLVVGVEAESLGTGDPLSPAVLAGVQRAADVVVRLVTGRVLDR